MALATASARADDPVTRAPRRPPTAAQRVATEPKTVQQLFDAFSRGLLPDLNDPQQMKLFELYRVSRLGARGSDSIGDAYEQVREFQAKYPDVVKMDFREVTYRRDSFQYPKMSELETGKSLTSLFANVQTMRAQLDDVFQGSRTKLVTPQRLTEADYAALYGTDGKPPWAGKTGEARHRILFAALLQQRAAKKGRGEATDYVDKLLVDVANTVGFENELVLETLKSRDTSSYEKLEALRKGIYRREDFVGEMSEFVKPEWVVPGGYEGLARFVGQRKATKLPDDTSLAKTLAAADAELHRKAVPMSGKPLRVRQLSRLEDPLRSLLGEDCAMGSYFEKALEADSIFFTQTDENAFSHGQATLILGTAGGVKVAMLDKLQNVPNDEIPFFLEGIRKSLEAEGYLLGIPEKLGDHNGLSNYSFTREYVAQELGPYRDSKQTLEGFTPHHKPLTKVGHSRSMQKLTLRVLQPMQKDLRETSKFRTGGKYPPEKMQRAHLDEILTEMRIRRNSVTLEDRLEYVNAAFAFRRAGVELDTRFHETALFWVADAKTPASLKNAIVRNQLEYASVSRHPDEWTKLAELTAKLTPLELRTFVQNAAQTERLADIFREHFFELGPLAPEIVERHRPIFRKALALRVESTSRPKLFEDLLAEVKPHVALLAQLPEVERAFVASALFADAHSPDRQELVMKLFGLSDFELVRAWYVYQEIHGDLFVANADSMKLFAKVGVTLPQLLDRLQPVNAAHSLASVYETMRPEDRASVDWKALTERVLARLDAEERALGELALPAAWQKIREARWSLPEAFFDVVADTRRRIDPKSDQERVRWFFSDSDREVIVPRKLLAEALSLVAATAPESREAVATLFFVATWPADLEHIQLQLAKVADPLVVERFLSLRLSNAQSLGSSPAVVETLLHLAALLDGPAGEQARRALRGYAPSSPAQAFESCGHAVSHFGIGGS